jgi:endonuclease V-like protein UPF0215 family
MHSEDEKKAETAIIQTLAGRIVAECDQYDIAIVLSALVAAMASVVVLSTEHAKLPEVLKLAHEQLDSSVSFLDDNRDAWTPDDSRN